MFSHFRTATLLLIVVSMVAFAVAVPVSAQTPPMPTIECTALTYYLYQGVTDATTNGEVTKLQKFLVASGYLDITVTISGYGYFGGYTAGAVKKFQTKYGITPTGTVGPTTRAKIKEVSCATAGFPVLSVSGTPSLTLQYDSTQRESALVAQFTISVSAGSSTDFVFTAGSVYGVFRDQNGQNQDTNNKSLKVTPISGATSEPTSYGATQYRVAKGQKATFNVELSALPQQMFQGIYTASLVHIYATYTTDGLSEKIPFSYNKTNQVTIVGEIAPYISSVSAGEKDGAGLDDVVTITGARLNTATMLEFSNGKSVPLGPSSSATTLSFTPRQVGLTPGMYSLWLDSANGKSNYWYFAVKDSSASAVTGQLDPASPASRTVTTNTAAATNGVVLGVFDLKAVGTNVTANTLSFTISGLANSSTAFSTLYLTDGVITYSIPVDSSTDSFQDLSIPLIQDQWKALTLKADVRSQSSFPNGTVISPALTLVYGTNSAGAFVRSEMLIKANPVTFFATDVLLISNQITMATLIDNGQSAPTKASVVFRFRLTNTTNSDIYISRLPYKALATSSTAASANLSTLLTSPSVLAGDTAGIYIVPAGTVRDFATEGLMDNTTGTTGLKEFKITKIYYSDDIGILQKYAITSNLEGLRATANLAGSGTTAPAQSVTGFTLINADTEQPISGFNPLTNGQTIDLRQLPTKNLNIRASTNPNTVGSVKFVLTGAESRTWVEGGAPYALFGDVSGNYNAWVPKGGSYTLTATPYTLSSASGIAGTPSIINFSVVTGTTSATTNTSQTASLIQALQDLLNDLRTSVGQ